MRGAPGRRVAAHWTRSVVLGAVALCALAVAVVVWTKVLATLRNPEPVQSSLAPKAFVWGDRVFSSRQELATWLRTHGSSYASWSRAHPASAALLDGRAPPPATASGGGGGLSGGYVLALVLFGLAAVAVAGAAALRGRAGAEEQLEGANVWPPPRAALRPVPAEAPQPAPEPPSPPEPAPAAPEPVAAAPKPRPSDKVSQGRTAAPRIEPPARREPEPLRPVPVEESAEPEPLRSVPVEEAAEPEPEPAPVGERCEIAWWRGYTVSEFYAWSLDEGRQLARSERFRWRRSEPPPEREDTRAALDGLVASLTADGWQPSGRGAAWFALHFERLPEGTAEPAPAEPLPLEQSASAPS